VIETDPGIAFFFATYILIGNVLLLNVVVAVLLDGSFCIRCHIKHLCTLESERLFIGTRFSHL
jgi:hypothetical protein